MKEVEIIENGKSIVEIANSRPEWYPILNTIITTISSTFGNSSTPNGVEGMGIALKLISTDIETVKDNIVKLNTYLLKEVDGKPNFLLFSEKNKNQNFYSLINKLNNNFGGVFSMDEFAKMDPVAKLADKKEKEDILSKNKLFNLVNKYDFSTNEKLYTSFIPQKYNKTTKQLNGEEYGAISFDRTGGHSITALMLLAKKDSKGKPLYTFEEVFDSNKLLKEKETIFEEVVQRSSKAGPVSKADKPGNEDTEWLVDTMFDIIMAASDQVNELAEKIDISDDNFIFSEDFIKVCTLASTVFDVWQEIWRYNDTCEKKLEKEFPEIKKSGERYDHFSNLCGPFAGFYADINVISRNCNLYYTNSPEPINMPGMIASALKLSFAKEAFLDWKKNGKGQPATVYMNSKKYSEIYHTFAMDANEQSDELFWNIHKADKALTMSKFQDGSLFKNTKYVPDKSGKKGRFINVPVYNPETKEFDIPGVKKNEKKNEKKNITIKPDNRRTKDIILDTKIIKDIIPDNKKTKNKILNDKKNDNIIQIDDDNIINVNSQPDDNEIITTVSQPEDNEVTHESITFEAQVKDNANFSLNLKEARSYLQAFKEIAGNARGFVDSPEYTRFYMAIDDVRDELEKLIELDNANNIQNKDIDIYADYKAAVRRLKKCAKAYESYKLSDHTENPKAEPEMKKLNSDDKRKLKIVRDVDKTIYFKVDVAVKNKVAGKDITDEEFLKKTDEALARLGKGEYSSKNKYVRDSAYAIIGQMYRFGGNKQPVSSKTGENLSLWDYMKEKLNSGEFEKSLRSSADPDKFISPKAIARLASDKTKIGDISKSNIRSHALKLDAFSSDMKQLITDINQTYGKGRSDSKPSSLMKDVLIAMRRSLRDISNVSNEEFINNISNIQTAVDSYLTKKGPSDKLDRTERRNYVQALKEKLISYKANAIKISSKNSKSIADNKSTVSKNIQPGKH